ncbi:unnamed protein product [Candida verbasci]|uniref:Uncharacterized protein n=1 Tax=Candida verbasci TaxID=1227364 RepID=A0A9W4TXW7_9ASCO|nr:unnamed protein product [Candida verbasci]
MSDSINFNFDDDDNTSRFWSTPRPTTNNIFRPLDDQPLNTNYSTTSGGYLTNTAGSNTTAGSNYTSNLSTTANSQLNSAASNIYKSSSLINAPSYVPRTAATSVNTTSNNDSLQEEYNKLKIELMLKNQIIKNLTDQLKKQPTTPVETRSDSNNTTFKVPKNHYQLFIDLSTTLQEKTQELEDTKKRLEVVLFASSQLQSASSSISGSSSTTTNSIHQYDVQELSHKILNKLNKLETENDQLLKLLSYGNKSSLLIEIGLLKQEIALLKQQSTQPQPQTQTQPQPSPTQSQSLYTSGSSAGI